ncbi:kinase domain protein [Burkholderia pseudomallei MSHR4377]|uniref:serine/threonine protein kinase n=1 Tax=Burkholderia pseudomallei TaxID=28450 RepID=UPI000538C37C|nr:protein kinase [Burkholderia pseudomallei]KGU94448.1 kinase domain protein [Burkholderia pseudomallei MSHR4377]
MYYDPAPNRLPSSHIVNSPIEADGRRYIIGGEIGRGFFGRVFECIDEFGTLLVAKVLVPRTQNEPGLRERWTREFKSLLRLRHPNVTYMHHAFEYGGSFFLIIERCGMTLDFVLKQPDMNPDDWLPIVAGDILQGLEFIHRQGYVHKDLHPGNILLTPAFNPLMGETRLTCKIADLGISRLASDINPFNTTLAQWMLPPEAICPQRFGFVGPQTDLYHVGLMLLAILRKGQPQFSEEEVLSGYPSNLAYVDASRFGKVIARALYPEVSRRTQTAMEFWRQLRAIT